MAVLIRARKDFGLYAGEFAFMLFGPLSKASWTKKLSESRSAYNSLREHFLKYVNNPDDLHSTVDPLADDEDSPWSSFRQDELSREEIFQDVTRCMQDNYYFREPTTQKKLLDILFIYAKLNPDTGYRQGMHELLAPVLWVIDQDIVDAARIPSSMKDKEGLDFMLQVLDKKYVEHDAFHLFCAIMQTAKGFYEIGETKDSATIITQSERIHKELLVAVDPDLAHHLQVIGVLPQVYSIRWIRLLFGREFAFKDVLRIWDLLLAESLTSEIIEMTCVAMLLRAHWQLIDVPYTTAVMRLTRFEIPVTDGGARALVKDAIYLCRNKTPEGGASLIHHYTGEMPRAATGMSLEDAPTRSTTSTPKPVPKRWSQVQQSPSRSPARFNTPQRQLESLFQEVSGNLQRRTEGWSKTVRGAVDEVKRNMNSLQTGQARAPSTEVLQSSSPDSGKMVLQRVRTLESRNKALAKMLDGALESLRSCRPGHSDSGSGTEDAFNMALAKIQFVSVYLADSDIALPPEEKAEQIDENPSTRKPDKREQETLAKTADQQEVDASPTPQDGTKAKGAAVVIGDHDTEESRSEQRPPPNSSDMETEQSAVSTRRTHVRPSLADSSFSFMLGENRHRSSFVSSVSDLPEQRRGSGPLPKPKQLWPDPKEKGKADRKEGEPDDDGFTLSSFR